MSYDVFGVPVIGWLVTVGAAILLLLIVGAYHAICHLLDDNCDALVGVAFRGMCWMSMLTVAYVFLCQAAPTR